MTYHVYQYRRDDAGQPWRRVATLEGGAAFNVELGGYLPKGGCRWQLEARDRLVGRTSRGAPLLAVVAVLES